MFPKIMHQTWRTKDLSSIPEFQACADSWRVYHPDYRYFLWDDQENSDFVKSEFAWYHDTWMSFDKNIKRLDSIRYMWMYVYGGVYADLDMECLQSLEGLLDCHRECDTILFCDLDAEGNCVSANPALIASKPGSKFWLEVLNYAAQNRANYVTECTGPVALGRVASTACARFRIKLLDQNRLFIRKYRQSFYSTIPGNEDDATIYKDVFCATPKPPKYFEDRKRKYVADWHGTPPQFRWHNEYAQPASARARPAQVAGMIGSIFRRFFGAPL